MAKEKSERNKSRRCGAYESRAEILSAAKDLLIEIEDEYGEREI
jgi:hypothetical protein